MINNDSWDEILDFNDKVIEIIFDSQNEAISIVSSLNIASKDSNDTKANLAEAKKVAPKLEMNQMKRVQQMQLQVIQN